MELVNRLLPVLDGGGERSFENEALHKGKFGYALGLRSQRPSTHNNSLKPTRPWRARIRLNRSHSSARMVAALRAGRLSSNPLGSYEEAPWTGSHS